jgi:hypothetical protein
MTPNATNNENNEMTAAKAVNRQTQQDGQFRQTAVDVVSVLELGTAALSMTTRRNLGLLCGRVENMAAECIHRGVVLEHYEKDRESLRGELLRLNKVIEEKDQTIDRQHSEVEKLQSQVKTLRAKARRRVVPSLN